MSYKNLNQEYKTFFIIISLCINIPLFLTDYIDRSYDAYTHIFFASHYKLAWFSPLDYRWFGGFSVHSYPPLAHQLIAILSYAFSYEWSYKLLTLLLVLIFPYSVYLFNKSVFQKDHPIVLLLATCLPSLYFTAYNFGQITTLLATCLVTMAASMLTLTSERRRLISAIAGLGLFVSAACSHMQTSIFFGFPLLFLITLNNIRKSKELVDKFLIILTMLLIFFFSYISIAPFWGFASSFPGGGHIPHPTHYNYIFHPRVLVLWFLPYYGAYLPIVIPKFKKLFTDGTIYVKGLKLLLIIYLMLGLGGTTPLPKILFGKHWYWLTYERFNFWASILLLTIFADYFEKILSNRKYLIYLFVVIAAASAASYNFSQLPSPMNLNSVISFLNSPENIKWRYITLGLGEPQFAKLSTYVRASTIDGTYYAARRIPELQFSNIGTIDSCRYYPNGIQTLEKILSNANKYSIKWIIVADPYYFDIIKSYNYTLLFSELNTKDPRLRGLTIWMKISVPELPLHELEFNSVNQNFYSVLWGVLPITHLSCSLVLLIIVRLKHFKIHRS